jgi:hypothetical protein
MSIYKLQPDSSVCQYQTANFDEAKRLDRKHRKDARHEVYKHAAEQREDECANKRG